MSVISRQVVRIETKVHHGLPGAITCFTPRRQESSVEISGWAGFGDVTWHTFRHTFASRLTRKGVDLVRVKELPGHSSVTVTVTVTMRHAHTNRETRKWAVGI
jgi:integrase